MQSALSNLLHHDHFYKLFILLVYPVNIRCYSLNAYANIPICSTSPAASRSQPSTYRNITCPTPPLLVNLCKNNPVRVLSINNDPQFTVMVIKLLFYCSISDTTAENSSSRLRGKLGNHPQLRVYQIFFGIRPGEDPLCLKPGINNSHPFFFCQN